MAEAESEAEETQEEKPKKGKLALILSLVLGLVGAGAGFAAVQFGAIPQLIGNTAEVKEKPAEPVRDGRNVAFVPLDPIVVSLGPQAAAKHLRFVAQMEVPEENEPVVAALRPRVMDTLNTYLRALTEEELREPAAMLRVRAQM
ncbi:MAG: flagellar basal body-associated FliL family protein, partial [Pseudomonadota bacterium]